jgi:hypothetical protein
MNTVGMTRQEKLRAEAKLRRIAGVSKLNISIKAARERKEYEDYYTEVGKVVDTVDYDEGFDRNEVARYGFSISEGTY